MSLVLEVVVPANNNKTRPWYTQECKWVSTKVSEYDQEITQSHTADQPTAP